MAIAEITRIESVAPKNKLDQAALLRWTAQAHAASHEDTLPEGPLKDDRLPALLPRLFGRYGVNPTQIATRSFEVADVFVPERKDMEIYGPSNGGRGGDMSVRSSFFLKRSCEVFEKFYPEDSLAPAHLIHVTCTGYASPSAPQRLVNQRNWSQTAVTHAYHMGCYASLPAVRMAEGLVSALKTREAEGPFGVDVVHTEMCSLHFNPLDHTPEQIVVQSLFGDGHIKYSLVPEGSAKKGFSVMKVKEAILKDTYDDMTWTPAPWGMQMTLSREIPEKIKLAVRPFISELIDGSGLTLADVLRSARFAIHPGGPKIIDLVQRELELRDDQVASSRKILLNRGNMSSATLPHVWKDMLDTSYESATIVVSLAFGPGLTVFGSLFKMI